MGSRVDRRVDDEANQLRVVEVLEEHRRDPAGERLVLLVWGSGLKVWG